MLVHLTDVNGTTPILIHTPHTTPVLTSASANAVKGVSSEGLSIAVQPAARAAPALRVAMARGKFHCTNQKRESAMKQAAEELQTLSQ